jgi:D-beta-D-heptose 7-phosphate kinase/D-beta-D-heptose 1-phosphate adenosyltransferase
MGIAVIGDALLDIYRTIEKTEWDDAIDGWVYAVRRERSCPGGAASVAATVRALGRAADLVSIVGADVAGEQLLRLLCCRSIGVKHIERVGEFGTPVLTRLMDLDQVGSVRIDQTGGNPSGRRLGLSSIGMAEVLTNCDAAVASDYGRVIAPTTAQEAVAICRRRGVPLIVDPSVESAPWFEGATGFKLNLREARELVGDGSSECEVLASQICCRFLLDFVVITNGAEGATAVTDGGAITRAREDAICINPTGGGDAVAGGLAVSLADGFSLADSLATAVQAAARAVETACTCPRKPCLSDAVPPC